MNLKFDSKFGARGFCTENEHEKRSKFAMAGREIERIRHGNRDMYLLKVNLVRHVRGGLFYARVCRAVHDDIHSITMFE